MRPEVHGLIISRLDDTDAVFTHQDNGLQVKMPREKFDKINRPRMVFLVLSEEWPELKDNLVTLKQDNKTLLIRDEAVVQNGVYWHQCIKPHCKTIIEFDDEPYCFTHSPDEGSSLIGWSARREGLPETTPSQ